VGLASDAGYGEGRNVAVEYRWAENQIDRLPALAADLVRRRVAVIVAAGNQAAQAAKAATTAIPIVFTIGNDPVALGLVASLNRPGANVTGATFLSAELAPKRLQLLRDLIPDATSFGVLMDPAPRGGQSLVAGLQAAARTLRVHLIVVNAGTDNDLETAFSIFSQQRVGAVMNRRGSVPDAYRLAGVYTGRVLSGAKPVDLPVQQSTRVELVINLKTARTLGIAIPTALLVRADEVIE
jgi:putative ABC transport system substrate-binding protein